METNLSRYKKDLERLINEGELLYFSLLFELNLISEKTKKELKTTLKEMKLPSFRNEYETWYSESMELIKQILLGRLDDFVKLYKNDKRKKIDYLTYTLSDYMIGVVTTRGIQTIAEPKSAVPKFQQQLSILKSTQQRFESSLFDIKQLLQADIYDDELDAAHELLKKGFIRGAGAIAGVVLERHLLQICENHNINVRKKDPSISDYNDLLKQANVIEVSTWRYIQHLADIRNLSDHKKNREPKEEEVKDLIEGVAKIIKSIF